MPKITVVVRKAFGFGACAMTGRGGEQSLVVALADGGFCLSSGAGRGGGGVQKRDEAARTPRQHYEKSKPGMLAALAR